jgi:hypothetical protein
VDDREYVIGVCPVLCNRELERTYDIPGEANRLYDDTAFDHYALVART